MNNLIQLILDNRTRPQTPVNLAVENDEATLYVYDIISKDYGVSAQGVINALAGIGNAKTLHIRINSPGGDIFEARAIIEAIKRFTGKTISHIDALAASSASSIALAADEVEISDGGMLMIHNASGLAYGDKKALRDRADLLETVEGIISTEYATATGQDEKQIVEWMEAETWFTATQAIEAGFVDRLATTAAKVENTWNLAAFANAPKALLKPADPPIEPPKPEEKPVEQKLDKTVSNRNRLRLLEVV